MRKELIKKRTEMNVSVAADSHLHHLLASDYSSDPCELAGSALCHATCLLPYEKLFVAIRQWRMSLHAQQKRLDHAWVCFRRYTDEDSAPADATGCCSVLELLSCLGKCYSEEFKHVELAFLMKENIGGVYTSSVISWTVDIQGSSSEGSGRVRAIHRNALECYKPEKWSTFKLQFTQEEILALFLYCTRQSDKPMNEYGLYCNFLPLLRWCCVGQSQCEEQSYFCSQLISGALKWVRPQQYATLEPRKCTPLALFEMLRRDNAIAEGREFRTL
jgi:hypothetical protein